MDDGYFFDNIVISNSVEEAEKVGGAFFKAALVASERGGGACEWAGRCHPQHCGGGGEGGRLRLGGSCSGVHTTQGCTPLWSRTGGLVWFPSPLSGFACSSHAAHTQVRAKTWEPKKKIEVRCAGTRCCGWLVGKPNSRRAGSGTPAANSAAAPCVLRCRCPLRVSCLLAPLPC